MGKILLGKRFYDSSGNIFTGTVRFKLVEKDSTWIIDTSFTPLTATYDATNKCHTVELDDDVKYNYIWEVSSTNLWETVNTLNGIEHTHAVESHNHTISNITDLVATVSGDPIATSAIGITVGKMGGYINYFVSVNWTDSTTGLIFYDVQYLFSAETASTLPTNWEVNVVQEATTQKNLNFQLPYFNWGVDGSGDPYATKIWVRIRRRNINNDEGAWSSWDSAVSDYIPNIWDEEVVENLAILLAPKFQTATSENITLR